MVCHRQAIRVALAQKGWKQYQLAEKLQNSNSLVSSWLANEDIHLSTLNKLAKVFGLTTVEFMKLGEIDDETSDKSSG